MDCEKVKKSLADYSADNLSSAAKSQIEAHLADCEDCANEYNDLKTILSMVDNMPPVEPSRDLWSGVYARITVEPRYSFLYRTREFFNRKSIKWSLGFSAAMLLIIMLLAGLDNSPDKSNQALNEPSNFLQEHIIYTNTDMLSDPASSGLEVMLVNTDFNGAR